MGSQFLKYVFLNEEHLSEEKSEILLNRAFLHGDGFFTTFLLENGKICAFQRHLQRLEHSCSILKLDYPDSLNKTKLVELLNRNKFHSSTRVRIMVWRKTGTAYHVQHNCDADVAIILQKQVEDNVSIHLVSVSVPRIPNQVMPSSVKWINGVNSMLAQQEAYLKGGNLALQTNIQGKISETSYACLGWFIDNAFYYPDNSCDALSGTTLQDFCQFLEERKIGVRPIAQPLNTLSKYAEIILLNAIRGAFVPELFNAKAVTYSKKTVDLLHAFNRWRLEHAYVLES